MLALAISMSVVVIGVLIYWLLIITEGTYFGPRFVAYLYDLSAKRYDGIKAVRFVDEAYFIGIPLARALSHTRSPLILDVATGSGRVPQALVRQWDVTGHVVGIDRSHRMLLEARQALSDAARVSLCRQEASALAFADSIFDCVTCLEALEFIRDPETVLGEMLRVLRPNGVLLLSNRIGGEAPFFPGRISGRGQLERLLVQLGLDRVEMQRWQVHYDLVWAKKPPENAHDARSTESKRERTLME